MILHRFNKHFQSLVLIHPWRAVLLSAIFIALSSYGLLDIQQEVDPRQFFAEDVSQLKYFKQVEDR